MDYKKLIEEAVKAKEYSYSPYSKFRVGAALLSADGQIFRGTNVENSSYGLTNCAERTAVFKAYSEGITKFKSIVIISDLEEYCPPCGACRQVLSDLCGPDLEVILATPSFDYRVFKLSELIPYSFGDENLKKRK